MSASQTKGSQSKGKGKGEPSGKPVEAKKSPSSFSRPEVKLVRKNASKWAVSPPVTKPTDPRLEVATSVATQVNQTLGLPKGKAKALSIAVTEAVVKPMPKYMPARTVKETLAKVAGPPPDVVTHIVPIGLLGSVAAQMPPSSDDVMVRALVNP